MKEDKDGMINVPSFLKKNISNNNNSSNVNVLFPKIKEKNLYVHSAYT
jgi:hypothetical protein